MKLSTTLAVLALVALSGCATLLDSMTTLDETTASQQLVLERVESALVDPGGATLPSLLARTEDAVVRLAGGDEDGRSLADLGRSLDRTNEAILGVSSILEGVLKNTESLMWQPGEAPPGEETGGSILGGVHRSTSTIARLVPERGTLILLGGILLGAFLAMLVSRR